MRVDIFTVGNVLIDLLVSLSESTPFCRIDQKTHELCLKAGQKIPAEHVGFVIGGGASRVAVGMRRLGVTSAVYAEIGDDELAERIRKTLQEEQVETTGLIKTAQVTSFTVGLNFQKERTLFTHHAKASHDFDFSSIEAKWIYLASLSHPWKNTYEDIVAYKEKTQVHMALNPGLLQLTEGLAYTKAMLKHVDVLFLNKQEAQMLLSTKEEQIKRLLQGVGNMMEGKIAVITDGRNGSYATDGKGGYFQLGIVQSEVVERTGAGDGYATGFLAAIIYEQSVPVAMQWGSLNAAAVVGEFGGLSGLLTKEQLEERLSGMSEDLTVKNL
jgi:sugar/nucleoside kinase (ribokinase family)